LKNFIKRYGEIEGKRKWNERQEKWRNTIKKRYIEIGGNVSKTSLDLFNYLDEYFGEREFQYGRMNEKYISDKGKKNSFGYDFTDSINNKIIEFNGDYWHMNPDKYSKDDFNKNKKMKAEEIWEYDKYKIDLAKDCGYDVLVIWENDYRKEPQKVLQECIKFLNNNETYN
jgi:very-short-patch-repair endonuclease